MGQIDPALAVLDEHYKYLVILLDAALGKVDAVQKLRHLADVHLRYGAPSDVVDHHDGVDRLRADEIAGELLDPPVYQAADGLYPCDDEHYRNGADRDECAHDVVADLIGLHGKKNVDKRGNDGDVEHVPEQHQYPRKPSPRLGGEEHLALAGGEAAPREQGGDLKPRLLLRKPHKAEKHGEQLGNYPVDEYQHGEQRRGDIDVHTSTAIPGYRYLPILF